MDKFKRFKYTFSHKIQIFKMWRMYNTKVSLYRVIMHDADKLFMILFLSKEKCKKYHRKFARHHNIKTLNDFYEAYLDCASARYTKPDKPDDALLTFEKRFKNLYIFALIHYNEVKFK